MISQMCCICVKMDPSDGHYQGSGFEQVIEHPESNLPLLNLSGSRVNVQGGTEQPPPDTTPVSHVNYRGSKDPQLPASSC
jgi:hypothetical protein